jgi:ABC-type dipeptide/oligopeptide/nickel transport system ATPase component
MRLRVKRFDPATLKPHRIIIVVGKRGTGKSVMQRDLMSHMANLVDFGLAMTPTEETVAMFRQHLPDTWIYNGFSATKLDQMITLQRELIQKNHHRSLFIIMDDCMYDKKVLKGAGMRDLFMNGRHLSICLCNAIQYVMDMGPDLRTQVDYVFALRENIISNKTKLWKYFFGMFEKYDDFSKVMDKCTEDHSAIVMDNTVGSSNIEDCIFWYKAKLDPGEFKMGKPIYWKLSDRYHKTMEEQEEEEAERQALQMMDLQQSSRKRISCVQCEDEDGKLISPHNDMLHL